CFLRLGAPDERVTSGTLEPRLERLLPGLVGGVRPVSHDLAVALVLEKSNPALNDTPAELVASDTALGEQEARGRGDDVRRGRDHKVEALSDHRLEEVPGQA